ncbi:MAG: WecB/TagA/CpsF family glycosyltransferase [Candidatus Andersenbacteria bacterium]|nr:WecB/TagA/CpsF family glycosyltransferase [Candidatus Andersenbacteria bacterium]
MESFKVGRTQCEIVDMREFAALCEKWLITNSFHHVVTLNPEMVVMAEGDKTFLKALQAADIRVPDGSGIIWAHWYVRSQFWSLFWSLVAFSFRSVERVTGVETMVMLSDLASRGGQSIYLLGGTTSQAAKTAAYLKKRYPNLEISVSAPHTATLGGPPEILLDIQAKKPDILLVAYGAPIQTVWIEEMRGRLPSVKIAVGVGGAFAIISEERPRAPRVLRKYNLEWLWRLILEPRRIRRIWRATVEFPRLVQRQKQQK